MTKAKRINRDISIKKENTAHTRSRNNVSPIYEVLDAGRVVEIRIDTSASMPSPFLK